MDQRILGIAALCLLGLLVVVKRISTGSILDKPNGGAFLQLVNIFNLFFLLVVNPFAGMALIARTLGAIDPTHINLNESWILTVLEVLGLGIYLTGYGLMAWALIILGSNYQLGGSAPRSQDTMVRGGPYKLIRHPMYTAALSIALGLACLTQSGAFFCVFCIYLVLILMLIPIEESGLQGAYREEYAAHRRKTRNLLPFIY